MSEFFHLSDERLAQLGVALDISSEHVAALGLFATEARAMKDKSVDKEKYLESLLQSPGVDPVLAVADGHPEDIPSEGWLITSHIAPGYGGVIHIGRYLEGAFEAETVTDDREKYGQVRLNYTLNGRTNGFAEHTIAYENPNYPAKDTEPFNRMSLSSYTGMPWSSTDIIALSNGGRLLDDKDHMVLRKGTSSSSIDWIDYSDPDKRKYMRDAQINRVVHGHEEVGGVLVNLGFGMGLNQEDVRILLETTASKIAGV